MIDLVELRKTWDLFVGEGGFTEVRILGKFQYSGYFKSFENLCKQLEPYTEMEDEQIYFVMNSIRPECYARPQCEKFVKSPKATTKDDEIVKRNFLLCDFDPVRLPNISSSPEQFELAHKKSKEVYRFLRGRGFSDMAVAISGSGWHLLIPVDIKCDDATDSIIKDFYTYMGKEFSDESVEFDVKVYNRSRITKLYSVVAKKGANLPSNPWRQSKIVYIPQQIEPTSIEKIKELADLVPKEEVKPVQRKNLCRNTDRFDIEAWLSTYGVEYKKKQEGTSTKYEIKTCPWHDTHSVDNPYSSAIYQDADGKLTYTCAHSHCADKQWVDFRLFYEPNAYERPVFQPQPYQPRPCAPQKPKYEIKQETPELGKKWLQMTDIAKVDLSAIPRVKTGISEIDSLILGLAETELTVLSGGNASGKTSLLDTLILNAINQGVPTAAYSGELPSNIFKSWLQMAAAGRDNLMPSKFNDGKFFVPNNVGERIDHWMTDKFFLFNNEYGNSVEEVIHDMEELLELGVKLFILDNMMSLDLEALEGGNSNVKQKSLIVRLKEFAKKNKVHVIVVAHPRKTTAFLRKNDISGTGDITNVADNVLIAHRVNQDFLKAGAEFYGQGEIMRFQGFGNVIEISKNRMYGVCDVLVGLHYEIESRRFKNTEYEDIHYGWEAAPKQQTYWNEPEHYEVYAEGEPDMPFAEYQGDDAAPF